MMDGRVRKLAHKLDAKLVEKLVEAGLDMPRKIKAAKDKDIKAVPGIGQSGVDKVRAVFPKIS
jgi:DNA integrity scanning protein DisA with diadenylate cyclase activity